jgi:hypothetical protein
VHGTLLKILKDGLHLLELLVQLDAVVIAITANEVRRY